MRRVLAPALVAAATLAYISTAGAVGQFDSVQGSGENNPSSLPTAAKFNIVAKSGPSGEDPKGHIILHRKDGASFKANVTCLRVAGNLATVGAEFEKGKNLPPSLENGGVTVFIQDNGKGQGQETVDRVAFDVRAVPPATCRTPIVPDRDPLTKGELTVDDETPTP
jgi:hypothetical protein